MAELTPKGQEKIAKLFPLNAKNIFDVTKKLTKDEEFTLDKLLTKLSGEEVN